MIQIAKTFWLDPFFLKQSEEATAADWSSDIGVVFRTLFGEGPGRTTTCEGSRGHI